MMLSLTVAMGSFGVPNPFAASPSFYVNPAYQAELDKSIATASGTTLTNLKKLREVPSAFWVDTKAKVQGNTTDSLEGILADAASKPDPATTASTACACHRRLTPQATPTS